jgi:uncharacterized protein
MQMDKRIEIKSVRDEDCLHVSGYASMFGICDFHNDIIEKGAFSKAISNKNIKLLWQHEQKEPIGKITKIFEDNKGLFIEAKITKGTIKGREAADLVSKGIINGLSIGFNVSKSYTNPSGSRVITEADLWEVSIVTFPANRQSEIITCKNEMGDIKQNISIEILENLKQLNEVFK